MRMSSSVGRLGKAGVQGSRDIAEKGSDGARRPERLVSSL